MTEEHPQGFRECKDELSMGKVQQDFLIQVLGKEECPFLTAGGAQIEPLTGEGAKIVVTAVRIAAADAGYPLAVIAAGEKVLANRLIFPMSISRSPSVTILSSMISTFAAFNVNNSSCSPVFD